MFWRADRGSMNIKLYNSGKLLKNCAPSCDSVRKKKLQQSTEIILIISTIARYTYNTKKYRVNGSSEILTLLVKGT